MIKKRITRIIAGVLSCILVGVFIGKFTQLEIEENKYYNNIYDSDIPVDDIYQEMNQIYYKLWAVGNMWLRNLDKNGNFTGTEELKNQTISALQGLGCMDKDGNISIDGLSYDFDYFVRYEGNEFSNTDKNYNELCNQYSLTRNRDNISYPSYHNYYRFYNADFNIYETNFGMHYYDLPDGNIALFDFDTSGLKSVVDCENAVIYYKTDGSTPVPELYWDGTYRNVIIENDVYYDEDSYNNYRRSIGEPIYEYGYEDENVSRETFYYDGVLYQRADLTQTEAIPESEFIPQETYFINNSPTISTFTTAEIVSRETLQESRTNVPEDTAETPEAPETPETPRTIQEVSQATTQVVSPATETTAVNIPDGLYMYDSASGALVRVESQQAQQPASNQIFTAERMPEMLLTIAISPSDSIVSQFDDFYSQLEEQNKELLHSVVNLLPLLVIAFILAIYVLVMGGYDEKNKKFAVSFFNRAFAEVYAAIGLLAAILAVAMTNYHDVCNFFERYYSVKYVAPLYGFAYCALFGICLLMLNALVVKIKCRCFWKNTLIYKIGGFVFRKVKKYNLKISEKIVSKDMLRNDKFTRRFILRTVVFLIGGAFVNMLLLDWSAYGLMFFVDLIISVGYIFLSLSDFKAINRISQHIYDISDGDYTPHSEPVTSPIYVMTQKLNNISSGIQNAVDRQVKSERMKIELVTNMSHDLKTPLTSIISYIDLLASEELSPTARDYVNIINNKSQHLKTMVSDLFDLAKATSQTDIDMEKIDAVILMNQVLADMSDKIEVSGRQVKSTIKPDSSPVMAEGKKMYRVLQNLIDNALKYSLEGTRIYVNLVNEFGYCSITVKNISSYEMDFAPDEIMERFTRGDKSRSTEGNGLGLSIAKSFTEACGGMFSISIDGDVFMAEVKLPIKNI